MPFYFGFDPTFIILIPALILALFAQFRVSGAFGKYGKTPTRKGMTGAEVARFLLERSGISDIRIEHAKGHLGDHYDPRERVLRLSDAVYNNASIAAVGVAAHETGHAVQHNLGYAPLTLRNSILPVASFGNTLAFPLLLLGLVFSSGSGGIGMILINTGIILFSLYVLFQLVTLPVEFNASNRAIEMLEENNLLTSEEIAPARKVLNAAALTYVAAAAMAIMNLIRLMLLSRSRRR